MRGVHVCAQPHERELCGGSGLGYQTKGLILNGRDSALAKGQDVVSNQSLSGCVGCMVRASGCEVLSMQEALGMIIEYAGMS